MEFAKMISDAREKLGLSRASFHKEAHFNFSCQTYKRIEEGHIPNLQEAIHIIKALNLDLKNGIYAWLRDQCNDNEIRSLFINKDESLPSIDPKDFKIGEALVINKPQANLLKKDPIYWELMNFIYGYQKISISINEIASVFNITEDEIREKLNDLYEYDLITQKADGTYAVAEWAFIGDEFYDLREKNFLRAFQQFQNAKRKYFITNSTYLTLDQEKEIVNKIKLLISGILDLPFTDPPPKSYPYTIGLFASPRRFGK